MERRKSEETEKELRRETKDSFVEIRGDIEEVRDDVKELHGEINYLQGQRDAQTTVTAIDIPISIVEEELEN